MLLDTALILGILLSLLGLSELLLRDAQRNFIKRCVEDLTLQLDYTRPLRWFNSLQTPSPVVPFFVFFGIFASYILLERGLRHLPGLPLFILWIVSTIAVGILTPSLILWRRSKDVLQRLKGDVRIWSLMHRVVRLGAESLWQGVSIGLPALLITTLAAVIVLMLLTFILRAAGIGVTASSADLMANIVFPVATVVVANFLYTRNPHRFLLWQLGMPIAVSVITLATLMALLEFELKFIRGMLWRIIEFQNGPVAAISLLLTTILAILKLFIAP
jgi:hypothetical protein